MYLLRNITCKLKCHFLHFTLEKEWPEIQQLSLYFTIWFGFVVLMASAVLLSSLKHAMSVFPVLDTEIQSRLYLPTIQKSPMFPNLYKTFLVNFNSRQDKRGI